MPGQSGIAMAIDEIEKHIHPAVAAVPPQVINRRRQRSGQEHSKSRPAPGVTANQQDMRQIGETKQSGKILPEESQTEQGTSQGIK